MEQDWRAALRGRLQTEYIQDAGTEWFDSIITPSGTLSITIVSNRFAGLAFPERSAQVTALVEELGVPVNPGFYSLYSVSEAALLEIARPSASVEPQLATWHDLAYYAANPSAGRQVPRRDPELPRTVVFYSFKGGVGRTTALVHVAAELARLGRKVVAVDLDLEAPGLGSVLTLRQPVPDKGIVDYFYDRLHRVQADSATPITKVLGEVDLQVPGRFLVVPAGSCLDLNYIAMVDDLRASANTPSGEDLWTVFARDLGKRVGPDVILVDSRTGINQWGALSLLRAADEVVVFLYPNDQNHQGISLVLRTLASVGKPIHVVFSPVPATDGPGMERVRGHWSSLHEQLRTARNPAEGDDLSADSGTPDPLVVPYMTHVALAERYPTSHRVPEYERLAALVDADTAGHRIETLLREANPMQVLGDVILERLEELGLRHLEPSRPSARRSYPIRTAFHRTPDFEKFLDPTTSVIYGLPGSGKSTLYWLFLNHRDVAHHLARRRMQGVTAITGHGAFRPY